MDYKLMLFDMAYVSQKKCRNAYFASGSYSDQSRTNSSRWCGPSIDQSRVR